ncbi:hypothetical protein PR048_025860 [Dryococelus australis]|uniref:Spatacsin C-terminal domain-containing protein n=1 Tax=Dryococelus australis TaxID=614101 RepID=A0ABQ9GJS7_9NEOP|nr:hypothetical protein PR048_025860 [Dryococelus australis]
MANHPFNSHLAVRGCAQVPGLKTAALDFLEKHHSDDKDTSRIVALHFQLHGRVGAQCLHEGEERLAALPAPLRNCPAACQALTAAMLDFSQAAQYLLQVCNSKLGFPKSH